MSLYVGHLSPHVRQEELERVFRRFGRCNLQLKDGYGFVIYEVPANAEIALRELRGKIICGEQISLNWSNRQPGLFQRSARNSRFNEPYRGRNLREEDNGVGFRGSRDRRDFSGASRVPTHNHRGNHLDDVLDKEAGHSFEDVDDIGSGKGTNFKERVTDEGGKSELNSGENDRWGEPASDRLTGHGLENDSDFDRYEPYHGYNRRDEKENNQMASSYDSPDKGSSQGKGWRQHSFDETERTIDKSKPQQACYNCGLVGHIMRNCPHRDNRQDKFSKFNHRRNEINFRDRGEERMKMFRPNSWGRPNYSRDPVISRHHTQDRKESQSEKAGRTGRSERFPERRKKSGSKPRTNSQAKRKRKPENGAPKKALKNRRARRSGTSSPSSVSSTTSSQSRSKSLGSNSGTSSRSRSRSVSSGSSSTPSSSRSISTSSYPKSRSSRSRSRSRSNLLMSLSLSVSLDQKSFPSPKSAHTNVPIGTSPNGNLEHLPAPESRHPFVVNLEDSDLIGTCSTLKDENAPIKFKVDGETSGEHPGSGGDTLYPSFKAGDKENNTFIDMHNDIDVTSENQGEKSDLNGDMCVKPNMQVPTRCEASYSTRISTQEMLGALRHYGLATPEGESSISVEGYFGAARLWPWEMIYYRRLRKGPISTENYARRLEQNKEFGIVDKYIRSSSGWGECN